MICCLRCMGGGRVGSFQKRCDLAFMTSISIQGTHWVSHYNLHLTSNILPFTVCYDQKAEFVCMVSNKKLLLLLLLLFCFLNIFFVNLVSHSLDPLIFLSLHIHPLNLQPPPGEKKHQPNKENKKHKQSIDSISRWKLHYVMMCPTVFPRPHTFITMSH